MFYALKMYIYRLVFNGYTIPKREKIYYVVIDAP